MGADHDEVNMVQPSIEKQSKPTNESYSDAFTHDD